MVSCKTCKKKINKLYIEMYTCKCKKLYCGIHRHTHKCDFDYKNEYQKLLKDKMPYISSDRGLVKI